MRRFTTGSAPDPVRRWWWAASQRTRLTTACLGTLAGMAACVLVLIPFQTVPYLHAFGLTDDSAPIQPGVPVVKRDAVVTIVSLAAVDALDGTDSANRPVLLRVPEIRSAPPCWAGPALDAAGQLLLGKQVTLSDLGEVEAGRVAARIRLPDGRDYAEAVVSAGFATAADDELAHAQDEARQAGKGLWGAHCEPAGTGKPPPPPTRTLPKPSTTPPSVPPPETTLPPPDGVQHDVHQGGRCSPLGARGETPKGQPVVCAPFIDGTTRWRRV